MRRLGGLAPSANRVYYYSVRRQQLNDSLYASKKKPKQYRRNQGNEGPMVASASDSSRFECELVMNWTEGLVRLDTKITQGHERQSVKHPVD